MLCFVVFPSYGFAATYEIVFRNKTPQTLTDAVCAVHGRKVSIFTVGEVASSGLSELAEDGVSSSFASELRGMQGIRSVKRGNFISPGRRSTMEISSRRGKRLSCVVGMLVATNDGFPAFRSVRLPRKVGQRRRFRAQAYDAGSEVNTESCDHVPGGPCNAHFVGEEEGDTVQLHPGIQGIADLGVDSHGWKEPAVRGRITRVR